MRFLYGIAALFAFLGFLSGVAIFFLVLTGLIDATGAERGGVLSGFLGGVTAIVLHGLWGAMHSLLGAAFWVSLLIILLGTLGALRRRCRWYLPLFGIFGSFVASLVREHGGKPLEWLGSVSQWDAAAFWGVGTAIGIAATGLVPVWTVGLYRWTNPRHPSGTHSQEPAAAQSGRLSYEGRVVAVCQQLVQLGGEA